MVSLQIFMMGLVAVSVLTTLTTQAIKKLARECGGKISSNILASIVSVVIAVLLGVAYAVTREIDVNVQYVICVIALAFLGWLCGMNGYDKVKQAIKQIIAGGDLDKENEDVKSDNDKQ